MYQFRFSGQEREISNLFKDPEISKAFETAFMDNYAMLLDRIREYQAFILSKNNPDSDPSSYAIRLSEDEIIKIFKETLQRMLLYYAIKDVFSSKFNVKENIFEILQGSYIEGSIMGQRLLYAFEEAIVNAEDSSICPSYEVLQDLESEFLQK